jgi:hypothetical protein
VGIGGFRAYIVGDVETIIGSTRRAFDASQANYHLETGGRWLWHGVTVNPFFHHVSRHLSDREKEQAVDWNMLGVRADARFSPGGQARSRRQRGPHDARLARRLSLGADRPR